MPGSANEHWSDIAMKNLVGQTCTFTMPLSSESGRGKIVSAVRKIQEPGRGGIWLTIEEIDD
jgi:hypothetical protein